MTNVADTTLIHRHAPRGLQARAFGLMGTAAFLGGSVASVAGGFLLDATSAGTVFVVAGVGTLAVTVLAVVMLPRATLSRSDGPAAAP
jgi:MFS family permease